LKQFKIRLKQKHGGGGVKVILTSRGASFKTFVDKGTSGVR